MRKIIAKLIPLFIKKRYYRYLFLKKVNKIKKEINIKRKESKKILFLLNTPIHGNLGDQAIAFAEFKFINDLVNFPVVEISHDDITKDFIIELSKLVSEKDVILLHGGGYLGDTWFLEELKARKIINTFFNNKIIIFPQTIYYSDTKEGKEKFKDSVEIYSNKKNLYLCARERVSYDFMKKNYEGTNILLIPDMVLYLMLDNVFEKEDKILFLLRDDREKLLKEDEFNLIRESVLNVNFDTYFSDTVISDKVFSNNREEVLNNFFKECMTSKLIVTDRLHGMVFSLLCNTPCVVMSNFNHKVKGIYEWIKDFKYIKFIENVNEFNAVIKELLNIDNCKYDNKIFLKYYLELAEIIKDGSYE